MPFCLASGQGFGKAIFRALTSKIGNLMGFSRGVAVIILGFLAWAEHDSYLKNAFRPTCHVQAVPLVGADARLICAAEAFVGLK
jgi:hypothetical protein